jgi:hypothetical protein
MKPCIYTYKITFEEVPYYYYGSKKEKYYNQEYWGSPKTNKWGWELYTPKKQILEIFDYSDEGYEKCRKVEDRLIKPVLNDPWCLNEGCGGNFSLDTKRKNGFNSLNLKKGIYGITEEEKQKARKKSGEKVKKLKKGIFARNKNQKILDGRSGGYKVKDLKIGYFDRTKEQMREDGIKGANITNSKKYKCTISNFISTAGPLTRYQKKRGIDPANRIQIN